VATLREIRRRVTSVKSTQKITKAMKMVAAAKLRRAQDALVSARPYAQKMNDLLRHLVTKVDPSIHPLLHERGIKRVVLVVVTGDRGMCGAFNGNVIKAALDHINTHYSSFLKEPDGVRIVTVGKKATDFFLKRKFTLYAKHVGLFGNLHIGHARTIIQQMTEDYLKGEFDKVEVIYNEFKSVIQQRIVVEQILPIPPEQIQKSKDLHTLAQVEYIYEPSSNEILSALLPKHLNFLMWHVLLESSTAEEGARMTAMNNATENAKELIRDLTLSYNKARQASITKELLEIVSGAEALKKAS
jgi:F-type H+-transporting ATPase subunit gamma